MPYTFKNLKDELKLTIFPNGTPENLEAPVDRFFEEAMIDLQRWIDCLQKNHIDIHPACSTYWRCARSVIDAPKGRINKVYTIRGDDYCQPVRYQQVEPWQLENWSRRFIELVNKPENTGLAKLELGLRYPEASTDSQHGRSPVGKWALERGSLIVAPWLQSDESLIVEWDGFKRKWSDDDLVPDENDLKKAVRKYVEQEFALVFEGDRQKREALLMDYYDQRADLMWECQEETKVHQTHVITEQPEAIRQAKLEADTLLPAESPSQDELQFAVIGDYGEDNANLDKVVDLIKGWDPDIIITTGDNNYPDGAAGTIDGPNGKFRAYIHPYKGSTPLESGETDATENLFFPTLGNHDLDTGDGQPYLDYFTLPGLERYYDFVREISDATVHFFCVNSGLKTDGALVEPHGNNKLSLQAEWLQVRLMQSTADWKIVYFHHPPYTSDVNYNPGTTELRWPFKEWGADLVLNGHGHHYERLEVDKFPYIVNGAGGKSLRGFAGSPLSESKVRYNDNYGAMLVKASSSQLVSEFINIDGAVIDTFKIKK